MEKKNNPLKIENKEVQVTPEHLSQLEIYLETLKTN